MRGRDVVGAACIELLAGRDVDSALVRDLGGPHADGAVDNPRQRYWLRVWAARGLLWAWDDDAMSSIIAALTDDAWRVREMAAKVVARHVLGAALAEVSRLRDDPVPRVRAAAARAVVRITDARA